MDAMIDSPDYVRAQDTASVHKNGRAFDRRGGDLDITKWDNIEGDASLEPISVKLETGYQCFIRDCVLVIISNQFLCA